MVFQCDGCESSFREKKNLQQHMRKRHGFKKYKCDHCNFHSDDRSHVRTHENLYMKINYLNVKIVNMQRILNLIYTDISDPNT